MMRTILTVFSPLFGLFIVILGTSFLSTLIAVRIDDMGASNFLVGVASSAYYLGMSFGAFKIESFVVRVGHIRAYSVFAALLTISSLLHCFWLNPFFWIVLRLLAGFGLAGIYIVIESWLLSYSTTMNRAQILSIYMIALYGAQSLGQLLLNIGGAGSLIPFMLAGLLAALSLIPISMTHQNSPIYTEPSVLTLRKLFVISPSGVFGCFMSGMVLSVLYGLLPRALEQFQYSDREISYLMATLIFGGMALQYPFGWLADKFNKRSILMLLSFALAVICGLSFLSVFGHAWFIYILMFVIGGLSFVLYPVSMSHTCDYASQKDMVAVTGGLLLVYGYGCILAPLIAPFLMNLFGPSGLYHFLAMCAATLGLFAFWRSGQRPPLPMDAQQHVIIQNPHTTPVSNELDPRVK